VQDTNRPHAVARRGDIQGLRALAVTLVVVYHFFPTYIPGGFVGVDVFFVISGFLISLLLLREIEATGRIALSRFYARRIRRLMPASLTVTVVTVVAAMLLLGPLQIADAFSDAAWSTAYLANVHLAQSPDGYFAVDDPSLFRHFWSLAVEEQYYLAWPLVLTAVASLARRRWKNIASVVLVAVLLASLFASIVLTDQGSSSAYYSLGTRAWELAIGGVVAFAVFRSVRPPRPAVASIAALAGLAAIVAAAFKFTEFTPFPGWTAAIPTVGAALIIWAGANHVGDISRALSLRPVRFLGDISYSLYLWHWPILILGAPFVGEGNIARLPLLFLSVALAIATYFGVERRAASFRIAFSSRKLVAVGLTTTVVAVAAFAGAGAAFPSTGGPAVTEASSVMANAEVINSAIRLTDVTPQFTPDALPTNVSPTLRGLTDDLAEVFTNGCASAGLIVCEGGDPSGVTSVAMIGDSQMGQWWPAVDTAAKSNGWKLFVVIKNACPAAFVSIVDPASGQSRPDCDAWQRPAVEAVAALEPDVILFANHSLAYHAESVDRMTFDAQWQAGIEEALAQLTSASPVIFFGQFPRLKMTPEQCLTENLNAVTNCSTQLIEAVPQDIRELDVAVAGAAAAVYFDPTQLLCRDDCPMVDHNRIMYRDSEHLTGSYSRLLAPAVGEAIRATLALQK